MNTIVNDGVLSQSPNVPDDVEVVAYIGEGNRAQVYKAKLNNIDVVIKVYKPSVAKKYSEKYKVDIAEYEYERNTALYGIDEIRQYIAKPFRVYTLSNIYSHSIIQEYVTGTILENLITDLGYLPKELLEIGYKLVRAAERSRIHDLDISVGNVMVNQVDGKWSPILYDFNIMPQYLFPPNPIVGLAFKFGIRKKSFRDYRSLRNWERRGKNKFWIGRN